MYINSTAPMPKPVLELRPPAKEDGASAHQLIAQCPPLDTNSMYCNLLQCSHFSDTSVAALLDGEFVGFVSGYLIPQRPDTLFIWQVAVAEAARGMGLAARMIKHILQRPVCKSVSNLETTITKDNQASWRLFQAVARSLNAEIKDEVMFDRQQHFAGSHDSEHLVTIGPFTSPHDAGSRQQSSLSSLAI